MRTTALVVLSCLSAAASGARAQPAPPPDAAPPPVAASPPTPAPGPYPPYPPAPYPAYPPQPYAAPPYYPGAPYIDPQAIYVYELQRRSPGLALVLEFFLPGAGSVYGGHAAGAAATWGMMVAGIALALGAAGAPAEDGRHSDAEVTMVVVGVGLFLGGRIFGLVDAYGSTVEHNHSLAQRLGLPPGLAVAPASIRVGDRVAWGPALSLRF